MIPPTRPSRPHRRADTFAFGSCETWRPLRLVLDDDTLAAAESAELLAFSRYPEVELMRTAPDAVPRLEIQEPTEDFVSIHSVRQRHRPALGLARRPPARAGSGGRRPVRHQRGRRVPRTRVRRGRRGG